ncbi:hypothetical protein QG37_08129 [Candidozyma auris]|uniref:Uncharacterized protein n=1 Tax=Candidozyma auris TaxID=498019 RepID=A0A0L0NPK1_CANAR|nr:hypothetical protein QG37_08129 [[Candida] auris]
MIGAVKASRQRIAQDEIMLQVLPEWLICGLDISAPGLQTVRLPKEACELLSGKKGKNVKRRSFHLTALLCSPLSRIPALTAAVLAPGVNWHI